METLTKKKKKFSSYIGNSDGIGCKVILYIYEEGLTNLWGNAQILIKYEEAVSNIWLFYRSILNFLIYEEHLIFFFISEECIVHFPPKPFYYGYQHCFICLPSDSTCRMLELNHGGARRPLQSRLCKISSGCHLHRRASLYVGREATSKRPLPPPLPPFQNGFQ